MFDKKEILFITPNAVKGFSVRGGVATELVNLSWTPEGIGMVLGTARAAIGRNVKLLVGEQFAYVATLLLPKGEEYASLQEEREAVRELAGKLIPEDLAISAWDYREISLPSASFGRPVQIVALVASFARVVVPAIKEAGFSVSVTLPESCAVALLFADRQEPFLLIYKSDLFFVAGVVQGVVVSSVTSLQTVNFETVKTVEGFMRDRFALTPRAIVFAGSYEESDLATFDRAEAERAGFIIEFSDKSAIKALAEEKVEGDDQSTLSIELSVSEKNAEFPEKEDHVKGEGTRERFRSHALDERTYAERTGKIGFSKRFPTRTRVMAVIFLVMLFLGVGVIFLLKWYD